jgi:hypothetical protein
VFLSGFEYNEITSKIDLNLECENYHMQRNAMPSVQSQGGGAQLGKEAVRPPNASTPIGMTSAAAATLCPAYNHKVAVLNSVLRSTSFCKKPLSIFSIQS